jgi:hypothetical protein
MSLLVLFGGGPPPPAAIILAGSTHITAGGENTAASRLAPPSGKTTSDFGLGRIQDDENPADAVDLTSGQYTELEWCIKAVSGVALDTEQYEFQVTAAGTALDTYTVTPHWTIGASGNTFNETLALAIADAFATAALLSLPRTLSLTTGQGFTTSKVVSISKTIALAQGADLTAARGLSLDAVVTLPGGATLQALRTLTATHAVTLSQATNYSASRVLSAANAVSLAAAQGLSVSRALTTNPSVTLGAAAQATLASFADVTNALVFASSLDLAAMRGINVGADVSLQHAAGLNTARGIAISEAIALANMAATSLTRQANLLNALAFGTGAAAGPAQQPLTMAAAQALSSQLALLVSRSSVMSASTALPANADVSTLGGLAFNQLVQLGAAGNLAVTPQHVLVASTLLATNATLTPPQAVLALQATVPLASRPALAAANSATLTQVLSLAQLIAGVFDRVSGIPVNETVSFAALAAMATDRSRTLTGIASLPGAAALTSTRTLSASRTVALNAAATLTPSAIGLLFGFHALTASGGFNIASTLVGQSATLLGTLEQLAAAGNVSASRIVQQNAGAQLAIAAFKSQVASTLLALQATHGVTRTNDAAAHLAISIQAAAQQIAKQLAQSTLTYGTNVAVDARSEATMARAIMLAVANQLALLDQLIGRFDPKLIDLIAETLVAAALSGQLLSQPTLAGTVFNKPSISGETLLPQ